MKWWGWVLLFLLTSAPALAVTITLSNVPSSISTDPFTLNVDISGPNPGTNYLRVDLFKDGTSNYFGETNNGSVYYSGSEGLQYFPVTISAEGTASAQLTAKMGSPIHAEYPGPGQYKLKIRRYTSSGSQASSDQQTPADLQITFDLPTPTPTNPPAPTKTPAPTSPPASTAIPKPTSTPISLPTPTTKLTTHSPQHTTQVLSEAADFFTNTSPTPVPLPGNPASSLQSPASVPWPAFLLIGLGLAGLGTSAFLFIHSKR